MHIPTPTSPVVTPITPPPFDPNEFQIEQFLRGMAGDLKSITWCIVNALLAHKFTCLGDRFAFGDCSTDPADLSAWTIIDLYAPNNRTTSFVASAVQKNGVRLYSFETDDGSLEDVPLAGNEAMIFDFLMQSVVRQLA